MTYSTVCPDCKGSGERVACGRVNCEGCIAPQDCEQAGIYRLCPLCKGTGWVALGVEDVCAISDTCPCSKLKEVIGGGCENFEFKLLTEQEVEDWMGPHWRNDKAGALQLIAKGHCKYPDDKGNPVKIIPYKE
jgi:hypothetical protein